MYLIVVGSLVVNIILYFLLACSTSFLEAIIYLGLSFIVKKAIEAATLIFYCAIFICVILASSEAFFHLSLHIVVILFVNLQGWCLALH